MMRQRTKQSGKPGQGQVARLARHRMRDWPMGTTRSGVRGEQAFPWWFLADRFDREDFRQRHGETFQPLQRRVGDLAPWEDVERLLAAVDGWFRGERDEVRLEDGWAEHTIGAGTFNLIPSPVTGRCQSLLVVVAVGDELRNRLREAHDHLIRCKETRLVLLVTDAWNDGYFERERRSTFEALARPLCVAVRMNGRFRRPWFVVGRSRRARNGAGGRYPA